MVEQIEAGKYYKVPAYDFARVVTAAASTTKKEDAFVIEKADGRMLELEPDCDISSWEEATEEEWENHTGTTVKNKKPKD